MEDELSQTNDLLRAQLLQGHQEGVGGGTIPWDIEGGGYTPNANYFGEVGEGREPLGYNSTQEWGYLPINSLSADRAQVPHYPILNNNPEQQQIPLTGCWHCNGPHWRRECPLLIPQGRPLAAGFTAVGRGTAIRPVMAPARGGRMRRGNNYRPAPPHATQEQARAIQTAGRHLNGPYGLTPQQSRW